MQTVRGKRLRQLLRVICGAIILITVLHAVFIIIPAYITGAYRWEYSSWQIKNIPSTWNFVDQSFISLVLLLIFLPFNGLLLFFLPIGGIISVLWQRKLLAVKETYFWLITLSCCTVFIYSTLNVVSMFVDWLID